MNMQPSQYTVFREISSQPQAWAELFPIMRENIEPIYKISTGIEEVIFSGNGSGFNASLTGAVILQSKTGITSRAIPTIALYKFPESVFNKRRKTLVILCSRSGDNVEVINALRSLKTKGIPTIGITCIEESPLATLSNLPLILNPVLEQNTITTRSLSGMILVIQLIATFICQDKAYLAELKRLPEICERYLKAFHDLGRTIGERSDISSFVFLANSPFYGIANEAQLKIRKMTLQSTNCYPAMGVRHESQTYVNENTLVTLFCSDAAVAEESAILEETRSNKGNTWAIADRAIPEFARHADHLLAIYSGLSQYARTILYLPALQFMAFYKALSLGMNPDEYNNL